MGAWEVLPEDSEIAAVHAALMPNGEVAYYSGNTGQDMPAATRIWNPQFREVREPPNAPDTDVFCSGLTLLWGGRLFVVGGTALYPGPDNPFIGSRAGYLFDPFGGWERVPDMAVGRWYPSAIMLADGRILVVSGLGDDGGITPLTEIYDPIANGWELLWEGANRLLPLYPRLHVLPNGEVVCVGNGADLCIFNPFAQEWRDIGSLGERGHRHDDLVAMVGPAWGPRLLHTGGATDDGFGAADAQIIEMVEPEPFWREIAPMAHPRWFPNSVLLPDNTLFVCGGGRVENGDPVMEPEIFDPVTETWRQDVPMEVPRLYHSTALLLPDGRVWVAGTDGETRMEVYSPDYLFNGPRPILFATPESVTYNQTFPIPMADAFDVADVCFIRLSAVTHAWNMGQRYLPLAFAATGREELEIVAPSDPNVAPPGHYLLFIRSSAGVPAEAPIVLLVAT